jgi:excisionase family DNA binding protein
MTARVDAAVAELVAALRDELRAEPSPATVELLSVEQAAQRAGIGRSLAFALIRRGELRSVKVGRRRLVPSDAIAALAAERSEAA